MTQRPFKVGDNIIMTADSGKGKVFNTYNNVLLKDTEYLGKVVELDTINSNGYEVGVKVEYDNIVRYFRNNGSCSTHPGMSIRHADEVSAVIKENCPECGKEIRNHLHDGRFTYGAHICVPPTPQKQEWVKGQISKDYEGKAWMFYPHDKSIRLTMNYSGLYSQDSYTHYMKADIQLPPPPPVDEVEAYGFMEAVSKILSGLEIRSSVDEIMAIIEAKHFFSLPATAENLNKYFLDSYKKDTGWPDNSDVNLDTFIHLNAGHKRYFKPAALEALGVK